MVKYKKQTIFIKRLFVFGDVMSYLLMSSSLGAIIDIAALAILVIFSIIGLIKGFAKTFISIFGTLISLLLAVLLCSSVAKFLQNQFGFINTVTNWVSGIVSKIFGDTIANTTLNQAVESELSQAGVASWIVKIIMEAQADTTIPLDTTLNQIISPTLAYYIVCFISAVGLFILFKILLFLLGEVVKKFSAIKIIGAIDKVLGLLLGLIRGVVVVQLAVFALNVIPLSFTQQISAEIINTKILKFITDINLFDIILKSLSSVDLLGFIKNTL